MTDDRRFFHIKKLNNVFAKIRTNHPSLMQEIHNYFAIYVDKYWFQPKVKLGIWDGKIRFVEKNGKFPIGLLKHIYNFVKRDDLRIIIDKELMKRFDASHDFAETTESWINPNMIPWDHQVDGALEALKYQRCILEHATSSGKSLTMAMIIMYCFKKDITQKALVLVPNLSLIEQLTNDFLDYGIPELWIGNFHGRQKDTEEKIIISTWQSMCKKKLLCQTFDMLISDECHGLRGDEVRSVAENAINAHIRIGCTGTMPEPKTEHFQIEGALGPIVHRVTAKQLIDKGHASNISIKVIYIQYPETIKKEIKGSTYDMEKKFLETYKPRNNVIKVLARKHMEKDHNMLVLLNKLDHADELFNHLKTIKEIEHIFIITGETDPKERERIRQFTNENKRVIIVATSGVFSTGVSIKRLHSIVFAAAGKSKIRTLQSVGRGLRLHKEKNKLILYDIGDSLKYSDKHLEKRLQFYAKAEFDLDVKEINLNGRI
jgi:superfamily II DNA or RNA helicase